MKFIGLQFKGTVKEQFREEFEKISKYGCWQDAEDPVLKDFANNGQFYYIPCGILNDMPDSWNYWVNPDALRNSYNINTGYWTFQCSVSIVYRNTIEHFLELLPYFIETVEYCEVFQEDWVYSHKYELFNNAMKLTDDKFIAYGVVEASCTKNIVAFRRSRDFSCNICSCKDAAKLQSVSINRNDCSNVITIVMCDDCLKQLGTDISEYQAIEPKYLGENPAIGCRDGMCKCGSVVRSIHKFCNECGVKLLWGNVRG